ncbi:MAG: hypothetical protein PWP22_820 [Thermoanaerobacter sp.]|nr:hypothetical protein [Thermoanaerobacter sp.]
MNICIFAKGLPVHIRGGMERHIEDLVNGLVKRGHRVTIITTKHPENVKKEEKENLKIYYVGDKPLRYTKRFYYESAKLFEELDKEENFDIVHSQSIAGYGVVEYCQLNKPLIVTLHGTHLNEIKSALSSKSMKGFALAFYLIFKRLIDRSDKELLQKDVKVITVSYELYKDVKEQYKISEDKLVVIPNGVDTNRFKPMNVDDLREKMSLTNEKIILSVGRIEKQKGYHLLIKLLPEILKTHDVKLVIVGTGSYLPNLKKLAVKLGVSDNVIFVGKVSDNELPKYYNLADVFAFPTLRIEGLPYVILEAMACGKPVVASRIGGIPTVIENGKEGLLVKPNDLENLKDKLLMLLEDEKMAKKLGKNAREKVVRKFSVDKMIDSTVRLYEEHIYKS